MRVYESGSLSKIEQARRVNLAAELVGRYAADLLGVDDWRSPEVADLLMGSAVVARGTPAACVGWAMPTDAEQVADTRADCDPLTERELLALRSLGLPQHKRILATIDGLRRELLEVSGSRGLRC
jgi:hypothetical protein